MAWIGSSFFDEGVSGGGIGEYKTNYRDEMSGSFFLEVVFL